MGKERIDEGIELGGTDSHEGEADSRDHTFELERPDLYIFPDDGFEKGKGASYNREALDEKGGDCAEGKCKGGGLRIPLFDTPQNEEKGEVKKGGRKTGEKIATISLKERGEESVERNEEHAWKHDHGEQKDCTCRL